MTVSWVASLASVAIQEELGAWQAIGRGAVGLVVAVVLGLLIRRIFLAWARRHLMREPTGMAGDLLRYFAAPAAWGGVLLAVYVARPIAYPDLPRDGWLDHVFLVFLILLAGWFAIAAVRAGEAVVRRRFRVDVRDNLEARRIHTQAEVVRKVVVAVIVVVILATILMTFGPLRQLGAGILASAGLAGLILGFAAQRTLGNLLAGIQIAVTQPIRLDDVVIVEGEWGWVEEISLTYVVVRVWDLRRMVLPISWFIENPFQNWTRTSANILGTVFLYTDYLVPVAEVRKELERVLDESPHWDRQVWRLHVTEITERAVELRCLMSAADSPTAWELRCEVRERLLEWLQREYPDALVRVRAELGGKRSRDAVARSDPSEVSEG